MNNISPQEHGAEENILNEEREISGGWRELHNVKHHNLGSPPNILWVIKLKAMEWAENVACMNEVRSI